MLSPLVWRCLVQGVDSRVSRWEPSGVAARHPRRVAGQSVGRPPHWASSPLPASRWVATHDPQDPSLEIQGIIGHRAVHGGQDPASLIIERSFSSRSRVARVRWPQAPEQHVCRGPGRFTHSHGLRQSGAWQAAVSGTVMAGSCTIHRWPLMGCSPRARHPDPATDLVHLAVSVGWLRAGLSVGLGPRGHGVRHYGLLVARWLRGVRRHGREGRPIRA